jgi:hypothetical protein
MSAALDHLAARVATDPLFLANALAEYARSEGLDDAGLAIALGCPVADLTRLRLCGAPHGDREQVRAGVAAIAARFGLDPSALAAIILRGQALARLRAAPPAQVEPGFLLAARDAEPPPEENGP